MEKGDCSFSKGKYKDCLMKLLIKMSKKEGTPSKVIKTSSLDIIPRSFVLKLDLFSKKRKENLFKSSVLIFLSGSVICFLKVLAF